MLVKSLSFNQTKVAWGQKINMTQKSSKKDYKLHENGNPVKNLAGEYGLVKQTIHRWKKRYSIIFKPEEGDTIPQAVVTAMQK